MASKKISVVVEAIVRGARQKLQGVTDELQNLGREAKRSGAGVEKSMDGMGGGMLTMRNAAIGALVAVGAHYAKMAAEAVVAMARVSAVNLDLEASFESLAARSGLASDAIIEALTKASKGTVDKFSLMLQANKAMRLGVATTTQEFSDLMKIAMVRAKEFGLTTAQAWEYIVTGIGRASPMILDNIGILMDAQTTYREYAESIGKTAEQLDILEKKEAIRNRILREGTDDLERWVEMGESASDVFARYDATMVELRQEMGEVFLPVVLETTEAILGLKKAMLDADEAQEDLLTTVIQTSPSLQDAAERWANYEQATQGGRWAMEGFKDYQEGDAIPTHEQWNRTIAASIPILNELEGAMGQWERAARDMGAWGGVTMEGLEDAFDGLWSRFDYLYDQYEEAGDAAERSSRTQVDAWGRVEDAIARIQQRAAEQRAALDRRAAQDRARLERRLADDLAAIQIDAARDRLDAHTDYYRSLRDLDADYAFDRQEAERRLAFDVFEAAGRRDAIGIRRMQRQARYERGRAQREHRHERSQLGRHFGDKLDDLQTALEREQEDRNRAYDIQLRELEIRMAEQREEARIQEELRTQEAIDEWERRNQTEEQIADDHLNREMLPLYGTYYENLMGYDQAWRDQVQQPVVFPTPPPVPAPTPTPGPGPPPGPGPTDCPDGYFWDGTHCVRAPVLQMGGIVPGTYGEPVPIMAHAGEFVMPSRMSQRLGAESLSTLNINISGSLDVTGEPVMAEQISAQIEEGLMIAINRVTGQRV